MAKLYHQRFTRYCIYVCSLHDFIRVAGTTNVLFNLAMKLSFSCHATVQTFFRKLTAFST